MNESDIQTWFLFFSLFFPRICLFFAWIGGNLPHNNTPFIVDFLCSIFVPRILIMFYIVDNLGFGPWFYLHLFFLIFTWGTCAVRSQQEGGGK